MDDQSDSEHKKKYDLLKNTLKLLSRDSMLENLSMDQLSAKLFILEVITQSDWELVKSVSLTVEKKLLLLGPGSFLLLKRPETVIHGLKAFSDEESIPRPKHLLRLVWDVDEICKDPSLTTTTSNVVQCGATFDEAVEHLKNFYQHECEVMKQHWKKLMDYPAEFTMDDMYVELEIVSADRREHKKTSSYEDLFGMKEKRKRRHRKIVLEGDPGMGKTTYVHRLVYKWATEDNSWLNQEFDLVIVVKLGSVKPGTTIFDHMRNHIAEEYRAALIDFVSDLRNHDRILFVLDAFDEMQENCTSLEKLIRDNTLDLCSQTDNPNAAKTVCTSSITLLISTRISHSSKEALSQRDSLVRTLGFNLDTVREKFSSKIENLEATIANEYHSQFTLYKNPLFIGIACSLEHVPGELFDMMKEFTEKAIHRYWKRKKEESEDYRPAQTEEQILKFLGKIAFFQLWKTWGIGFITREYYQHLSDLMSFLEDEIDIHPTSISLCCDIGLLWPHKHTIDNTTDLETKHEHSGLFKMRKSSFPHQLFCEYLAAYYAVKVNALHKYLTNEPSYLSGPFLYFLSGFSSLHRSQLFKNSYCKRYHFLRNLWLYKPKRINLTDFLADQQEYILKILGGRERSSNKFLEKFAKERKELFRNTHIFEEILFDDASCKLLQCSTTQNPQFCSCDVAESGKEAFKTWCQARSVKCITISHTYYPRFGELIADIIQHTESLGKIVLMVYNDEAMRSFPFICGIIESVNKRAFESTCDVVIEDGTCPTLNETASSRSKADSQMRHHHRTLNEGDLLIQFEHKSPSAASLCEIEVCIQNESPCRVEVAFCSFETTEYILRNIIASEKGENFESSHRFSHLSLTYCQLTNGLLSLLSQWLIKLKSPVSVRLRLCQRIISYENYNYFHGKTVSYQDIASFMKCLSQIENLCTADMDLSGCIFVAPMHCLFLKSLAPEITTLNLSNCKLSDSAMEKLGEYLQGETKLLNVIITGNEPFCKKPRLSEVIKKFR